MFSMDQGEVVDGKIQKVNEFGAFVLIGPLSTVAQVSDLRRTGKRRNVTGYCSVRSSSGRYIGESSHIRARIVSKSINHNDLK